MRAPEFRLYVHQKVSRWLAILLGLVALVAVVLYFAAPDVPKLAAVPVILLFGFLLFKSNRASRSWIEITPDGKTLARVPSWYDRLAGDTANKVAIPPSSELLLCKNWAYGGFDGYSADLRLPDGSEQQVWKGMQGMDYHRCAEFRSEVQGSLGLAVRLLRRQRSDRGLQESEWTAQTARVNRKAIALGLGLWFLPAAGILARIMSANFLYLAAVGAFLWAVGLSVSWIVLRSYPRTTKDRPALGLYFFRWTMEFGCFYAVAVFATGALLKR